MKFAMNLWLFVTGFVKTVPNGTRIEIQFIGEYYLALPRNTKHIAIND